MSSIFDFNEILSCRLALCGDVGSTLGWPFSRGRVFFTFWNVPASPAGVLTLQTGLCHPSAEDAPCQPAALSPLGTPLPQSQGVDAERLRFPRVVAHTVFSARENPGMFLGS